MSGFFGKVIDIDDGYIGTLNAGAIVFTPSASNPIPSGTAGLYINDEGSFAISDTNSETSVIIVENTFSLTLDSYVDYTTFQENKTAQEEINDTILVALDGYATAVGSGVSEETFQENKTAQEEINDTILTALDGYAAVQGTATQIAYFSGVNTLTSDTNLSFDTTNNRLLAHSIQITGGQQSDGYVLTSDASGVASWQRPPIALASDKIYTVDATHPSADFTTIQAAIDHASDGYIILVSPGSYNEQLNLRAGITVEIRGTGPDYASTNIEYVLSGDGYVINGPDAGAGSIVFKNMNIALRYNGFSGSTATILARSTSFGWIFRDCYITAYTLGASGGQTHAILANAASVMEFYNCEIVADDNDGIFNVESIRQIRSTIILDNTSVYGFNNYDIHVDDPAASLFISNSEMSGVVNIQNIQSLVLNKVSKIGSLVGNITDDDTENLLTHNVYGVGLTSGKNDFYKLHLRELGQVDVGLPGDGEIWYSRAAGRFRMKEGGVIKDMIPYDVLDGYSSANKREKSITIESPTASEDVSWFFVNRAVTITEIRAVVVQSSPSPSVTWTIRHGTDRSAAGAEVVTSGTTTTSTTTGSDVTSFNDATIIADSFIWVETTASSNTSQLHLTIFYTED